MDITLLSHAAERPIHRRDHSLFTVDLEVLEAGDAQVYVVRDDRLGGGTKERACRPFLSELMELGHSDFLYASPFCGFAQVALAKTARDLGVSCTIFAEKDSRFETARRHEFTRLAQSYGAAVVLCDSLAQAQEFAEAMAAEGESAADWAHAGASDWAHAGGRAGFVATKRRYVIPLGFDHPSFHRNFERALHNAWVEIESQILSSGASMPARIWLPLGSGTFTKCMRKVVPLQIEIHLVDVGVLAPTDLRIQNVCGLPNTFYSKANELFSEPCTKRPPIPSNLHYDAKLWTFLVNEARPGDLWWNVAR